MRESSPVLIAVLVVGGLAGGFFWWRHSQAPKPQPVSASDGGNVSRAIARRAVDAVAAGDAGPTGPRHPIDEAPVASEAAAARDDVPTGDTDAFFRTALTNLLGKQGALSFLNLNEFVHRLVATVVNLDTEHAAVDLWPVKTTPGTFETETVGGGGGGVAVGAKNAARYDVFVRFVEAIDTRRAAALYLRAYPILQRGYEDLGFPGRHFNDRVVEVIDHLVATPNIKEPIRVKRVEASPNAPGASAPGGVVRAASPGRGGGGPTLYQFEDPTLEARSAGQKILLRMGHANAVRLKAKLLDVRAQIAKGAAAAPSRP